MSALQEFTTPACCNLERYSLNPYGGGPYVDSTPNISCVQHQLDAIQNFHSNQLSRYGTYSTAASMCLYLGMTV